MIPQYPGRRAGAAAREPMRRARFMIAPPEECRRNEASPNAGLTTASPRRSRCHRPAFESFEDKLLLSSLYVASGGSDSADGSAQRPWATLQHAADSVAPGDTVHVAPGQYNSAVVTRTSGTATARIRFVSDVPWGAHIRTTGSQVSWTNNGDDVDIQGFDITGDGRIGILSNGSYVRIVGNHVHDIPAVNTGRNGGAGINTGDYAAHDDVVLGNMVERIGAYTNPNAAHDVHGIYVSNARDVVQNNIVANVQSYGIHCWHAATDGTIANNLVFGANAGGIIVGQGDNGSTPQGADNFVVTNNIVVHNQGYGILEEGLTGTHNRYLNNLVSGNRSGAFALQNGNEDQATVVADPGFVNYRSDGTGDYHLAPGSPCIDAGTSQGAPAQDYAGAPRPQGAGLDIGPYPAARQDQRSRLRTR
jgi:hypothetical protein